MSAVSDQRTAMRAAAVALKADSSNMSPSEIAGINKFIADIDAEETDDPTGDVALHESVSSNMPYQLRVALEAKPVITSALTATVVHAQPFSYTITASHVPDSFNATGLPGGLTRSGAVISGTAPAAGTYPIVLSATNSGGTSATATLVLTVT